MKKIFVIDWWLVVLFLITAISGFGMHISGTRCPHEVWHIWAVVHTISSVAFLIAGIMHINTHLGWYKNWLMKGIGNKSRVTAILSVIFIFISITGIILIVAIDGANSGMGLWHYRIGIVMTGISLGHIIKRMPILKNSLANK